MNFNISIVDDRKEDRDRLEAGILAFFSLQPRDKINIETFESAEAFLPAFEPGKYHMAFLDIVMDEMNGIELAKRIRTQDPHLLIVFQTTSREYAFDAFPVHPFDYLMKPCEAEELDSVLTEALRVIGAGDPEITVATARDRFNVPLRSVCAAVSRGHNVDLILTNNQSLTSTETFKSISDKLSADSRFLLINRGVLINMDQVLSPIEGAMKMKDGKVYPVKVNGRAAVLSAFSQYMISRVDRRGI